MLTCSTKEKSCWMKRIMPEVPVACSAGQGWRGLWVRDSLHSSCRVAHENWKGKLQCTRSRRRLRLITKEAKLKGKRKLNTISWNLRLILSKGLKKLQRYLTPKKVKLFWKLQRNSVDRLNPAPQKLKRRSLIRVQFTCTVVKPVKKQEWLAT